MKTSKTLIVILFALFTLLAGCSLLPEKSPTQLEKSPCACGESAGRHV
jgi:hypothetical protein